MRTLPAGISALNGVASTRAPLFLIEIQWPAPAGTKYYSSGDQVTWNGHTWEKNRAMSIPILEAGLIDRKRTDFSKLQIKFDNLADNGSSSFPFTLLESGQNLEDAKVFVHIFSPDANDAIANVTWGFTGARDYNGEEKTVTITASFFWDSLDSPLPTKQIQQLGFDPTDASGQTNEDDEQDLIAPIVYGAGEMKTAGLVYRRQSNGSYLDVNFIVSGCNGQPFASNALTGAKLFNITDAVSIEFVPGSSGQTAPTNLSRFPDGGAHPNVAYGFATFSITDGIKDRDIKSNNIKLILANGRPLIDTTLPSENPVLILKDYLRDSNFSLGLPATAFDSVASSSGYASTRYQMRYEFHKQKPVSDVVQYMLANFHGFITFESALIQIKCKRNDETSVATFATCDSGVAGRKVHNDFVDVTIKDSSELINQVTIKYRRKKRQRRIVTLYDPTAQTRAGGTQKKVVEDKYDFWEDGGIYDEAQAQILAAIAVREEQNGNLFIKFASPFWDGIAISIGDLITVKSPDIFNNGSNQTFRVLKQTIETEGDYLIHFECQVYKQAIYNDNSVALGVDLLRGGDSTDAQGRPPDVVPTSLQILPVGPNDTEGKQTKIRANFTLPGFDPTSEQADGIFRESPIGEVEIYYNYDDEATNQAHYGNCRKVVQITTSQSLFIDFDVDYRKSRTLIVYFLAIGPNGARSPLGFIPDPTRVTTLSVLLSSSGATATVPSTTAFTVGDFVGIEREILQLLSKTSTTLTFVNASGVRTPFLDTASIAHPVGTEVAVLKVSYPNLAISFVQPKYQYPVVAGVVARQRGDGVRVKVNDIAAENLEDYLIYWSTDADANSNVSKLGSANPAWYMADPLAPPASVKLLLTKSLHKVIMQEDIGGAGVTVYVRVAARNGKRNFSSALSSLVSNNSTGATIPDTALTSSPAAPIVRPHASKIKFRAKRPTTNINQFVSCGVVARVKDGSGSILGYVVDGTTPTNNATEFKNVLEADYSDSFNWNKTAIQVLYPTATIIEFYNYITNGVGEGPASAVTTLTISTWTADPINADSAIVAAPAAPEILPHSRKIKIKCIRPTANFNQFVKNEIVARVKDAGGTILGYVRDGAPPSNNVLEFLNDVRDDLTHTFFWDKATIQSLYPTGATIEFYNRITNGFGPSGLGTAASMSISTWTADPVSGDTAVPTLATPSAPDVEELDGKINVDVPALVANLHTLKRMYVVMSTQNTAPTAGVAPSIGVDGVVKIKHGRSPSFRPKRPQTVNLYFYYIAENDAGFSAWSTGTLLDPSGISRPLEDVIGTGVPILPEGLERQTNSGTGHTTNTFVLDGGASAVDDYYNGMALHIPSLANTNRVVMITDYVGSTRTCTVSPTFSAAPSGSIAYEIDRIEIVGDCAGRSGTGHTTTKFVLDGGASAVTDFYKGYYLYVPALSSADQLRRIGGYNGSTKELTLAAGEDAFSGAPSGNMGYILVNGSFGFQNKDATGIIAPVPLRFYLDGDTDQNVVESLSPTGDNAFSLQQFHIQVFKRTGANELRFNEFIKLASANTYRFPAPVGYRPMTAIRLQNLFRSGGSDGWSVFSYYVRMPQSLSATSPGVPQYAPDTYPAKIIDFQGEDSYPDRYPVY